MQSLNELNNDIDNALKPFPPKNITPGGMKAILKKLAAFMNDLTLNKLSAWFVVGGGQPSLNGTDAVYRTGPVVVGRNTMDTSGAAFQASSASIDFINGNVGDSFRMPRYQTAPGDGLPAVRYYPFAELPASAVATLDFADFEITVKSWDNNTGKPTHIRLYVANRGAFYYEFSGTYLNNGGAAVEAYKQADGRVILYLRLDHAFRMATIRMTNSYQVTFYTPIPNGVGVPTGVILLDTSDVGNSIPLHRMDSDGLLHLPAGLDTFRVLAAGALPTVGGGASGVTPTIKAGSTDMAGTIGLATNGNPAANTNLVTVTFTKAYPKAPRVMLTAASVAGPGALLTLYVGSTSANGFTLACGQALSNNNYMEINYLVIG